MQGWTFETAWRMFLRAIQLLSLVERRLITVLVIFAGFENNCPSRWEYGVVDSQVIGFEGKASKDRRDSDGLTIGKIYHRRCHNGIRNCNCRISGSHGGKRQAFGSREDCSTLAVVLHLTCKSSTLAI